MNWTNTIVNYSKLFTLLLLFLIAGMAGAAKAQDTPFTKLKEKFEKGQIFAADFRHKSIDSYTQDTTSRSGWIWVGERRYKVRTNHQSVVVNGQTSMVYDNNRNRVIISKYEPSEDDFAPSRILNGIDSTFTVNVEEWRNGQFYVQLSSDDSFAIYKKVEIFISEENIPQKIRAVDPVDNVITTRFEHGRFVDEKEQMFRLDYPDGAEVVDMRSR